MVVSDVDFVGIREQFEEGFYEGEDNVLISADSFIQNAPKQNALKSFLNTLAYHTAERAKEWRSDRG